MRSTTQSNIMQSETFNGYRAPAEQDEPKTTIRINREQKEISLRDMTDQYNMPAGFNRGKQGIKKAFDYIEENMQELQTLTMYRAIERIEAVAPKLKFHTYCMMD